MIFTDIDFPFKTDAMRKMVIELISGTDFVVGERGESYLIQIPKSRAVISQLVRKVVRLLNLITFDSQCGLKGFSKSGKEVLLATKINRFMFDLELLINIKKRVDLSINKVDVELRDNIKLSKLTSKVIIKEFVNFITIFFK